MKITVTLKYEINGKTVEHTVAAEFNDNRGIIARLDPAQPSPEQLACLRAKALFASLERQS